MYWDIEKRCGVIKADRTWTTEPRRYSETCVKQGGGCPKPTLSSELVLCALSQAQLFVIPWTVACEAHHGILQAKILE